MWYRTEDKIVNLGLAQEIYISKEGTSWKVYASFRLNKVDVELDKFDTQNEALLHLNYILLLLNTKASDDEE